MLVRRNAEGEEEQEGEAEEHRRAASWLRARGELGVAPFWRGTAHDAARTLTPLRRLQG